MSFVKIDVGVKVVVDIVVKGELVYGINMGFGCLVSIYILYD